MTARVVTVQPNRERTSEDPADQAPVRSGRSRAAGVAGISSLLGALAVWGAAEAVKSGHHDDKVLKARITFVVAALTVVQLSLMTVIARSDVPRRLTLTRIHHRVGAVILLLGGFVTYMCFTGPFRTGVTLHRLAGFTVCTAVLVKITFARMLTSRRYLIASVGLTLFAGLQIAFFTKSVPVLFGNA